MDFYIVLGVERGATVTDIKRAYKRLARRFHPDINPGDRASAAQFRQIAEAYETLSDPDRRRRYDATGESTVHDEAVSVGFEGFDFSVSVSGSAASTFGDLFADVFHQREAGTQARASGSRARDTSAGAAERTATCTSRFMCSPMCSFGAKATTSTWSFRWQFMRPRSARRSRCRRSTGRRGCACRRAPSPVSDSAC